jgi:methylamine dehydrogenase heavy chain
MPRTSMLARACAALLAAQALSADPAAAQPASAPPAAPAAPAVIPQTEVSDVAVLPPPGPHRLLVGGGFQGGVQVIDGDAGKVQGQFYAAPGSNLVIDPKNRYYYLAETMWTHGNRGVRQDYLSVYDEQLKLVAEVNLPGRLIAVTKSPAFDISADGRFGYVFNMQPGTSVSVTDLMARKPFATVEIPGCGLVYPFGPSGFASLCSDGTLAVATLQAGKYTVSRAPKFFDAERDPVYEESPVDRQSGRALFLTYTGMVHPVTLGAAPVFDKPWNLLEAAGLPVPSTEPEVLSWRPGGSRLAAWHKATGRLFVLMHPGAHWTHKEPGTEIWVFDITTRKRLVRLPLKDGPAGAIAITQDEKPLLFASSGGGPEGAGGPSIRVLDPQTGEVLRTVRGVGSSVLAVSGF